MTKEEYLRLAESKWPELEELSNVSEIWVELGRAVLESSISEAVADRRKKRKSKPATGGSK